jgi:hypothetical protein
MIEERISASSDVRSHSDDDTNSKNEAALSGIKKNDTGIKLLEDKSDFFSVVR